MVLQVHLKVVDDLFCLCFGAVIYSVYCFMYVVESLGESLIHLRPPLLEHAMILSLL